MDIRHGFFAGKRGLSVVIAVILLTVPIVAVMFYFYAYSSEKSNITVVRFTGVNANCTDPESVRNTVWLPYKNAPIIIPEAEDEMAGGFGNLYAPEILRLNGTYYMWYGAQGSDGHDRIHMAVSHDGLVWNKLGTVIDNGNNNHVNDPSVVYVNGTFYMFYTIAPEDEMDIIGLAVSSDGINWTVKGGVFYPSESGWDSLKVGRPSVIYEEGLFKMWFDGCEADPLNPDKIKEGTGRHVGLAFSHDGYNWTRYSGNPIIRNGGAVDVEKIGDTYYIVEESPEGTVWGHSPNGINFTIEGFLFVKSGAAFDRYGHVTPFILSDGKRWIATYVGSATDKCWCRNRISVWFPFLNVTLWGGSPTNSNTSLVPEVMYADTPISLSLFYSYSAAPVGYITVRIGDENGSIDEYNGIYLGTSGGGRVFSFYFDGYRKVLYLIPLTGGPIPYTASEFPYSADEGPPSYTVKLRIHYAVGGCYAVFPERSNFKTIRSRPGTFSIQ